MLLKMALIAIVVMVQIGCSTVLGTATRDQGPSKTGNAGGTSATHPGEFIAASKPSSEQDPHFKPCNGLFPLVPGSRAVFEIQSPKASAATATVVVDRDSEGGKNLFKETTMRVAANGDSETTIKKYACDDEKVDLMSEAIDNKVGPASAHLEGTFESVATAIIPPRLMKPGAAWSYTMAAGVTMRGKPSAAPRTITVSYEVKGPETVTVPAGTFNSMRITGKVNGRKFDEYLADGIGLVKRSLADGTTWTLREYSGLTP